MILQIMSKNRSRMVRIAKQSMIMLLLSTATMMFGCSPDNQLPEPQLNEELNYYTQGSNNRTVAEWEPALGTIVTWPLGIPHQLAIELARDNHLYTMVENESFRSEAQKWFNTWGIPAGKVTFITADQGEYAWWTRDWGPSAVFSSNKQYQISNGKYVYGVPLSGLACADDLEFELETDRKGNLVQTVEEDYAPTAIAAQLGYSVLDLPFINTGGNVATDGLQTAISTCILSKENEYFGVSRASFEQMNESMLGFKKYNFISNFEEFGIQHIDCFMKIIDEETLLVAEPPGDHPMSDVYENIVNNELSKLKTSYGRPYNILRIKIGRYDKNDLAAYTNSLILNKIVYVPLFDIPEDAEALETWKKAMPGYTVKGFKYVTKNEPVVTDQVRDLYGSYGWNYGDALHCRARAIWDPEMLFITAKKVESVVDSEGQNKVYTTIIDYSGNGLEKDKCKVMWRVQGQSTWNETVLTQTENEDHFFAEIPNHESGATIEYYISAASKSGKTETKPRTAPLGYYKFSIK